MHSRASQPSTQSAPSATTEILFISWDDLVLDEPHLVEAKRRLNAFSMNRSNLLKYSIPKIKKRRDPYNYPRLDESKPKLRNKQRKPI